MCRLKRESIGLTLSSISVALIVGRDATRSLLSSADFDSLVPWLDTKGTTSWCVPSLVDGSLCKDTSQGDGGEGQKQKVSCRWPEVWEWGGSARVKWRINRAERSYALQIEISCGFESERNPSSFGILHSSWPLLYFDMDDDEARQASKRETYTKADVETTDSAEANAYRRSCMLLLCSCCGSTYSSNCWFFVLPLEEDLFVLLVVVRRSCCVGRSKRTPGRTFRGVLVNDFLWKYIWIDSYYHVYDCITSMVKRVQQ